MKETSQNLGADKATRVKHIIPAIMLLASIVGFYFLDQYVPPGWISYFASVIPLAIISFTCLARVCDISNNKTAWNWQLRRYGLVFGGLGTAALLLAPLGGVFDFPSWHEVMIYVGVAATFFTTPGIVPWWRFMSKGAE